MLVRSQIVMPERVIEFSVPAGTEPARADKIFAAEFDDISRTRLQRAFDAGRVTFDGEIIDKRFKVDRPGLLRAALEELKPDEGPQPVAIPVNMVYEDASMIVVNKPATSRTKRMNFGFDWKVPKHIACFSIDKLAVCCH